MKIGIDASRANTEQKTGVENYAFNIIEELKQIIPAEVQVVLYSKEQLQGNLSDLPKNWESKVLNWAPKYLWTQLRLSWEMWADPPDILFIPSHVFPLIHPEKTVMTVHDIAAARFPNSYNFFERWYSLWSAKWASKYLWKVITPSEFVKKELENYFKINNTSHIIPIHHGYEHQKILEKQNTLSENKILDKYNIKTPYLLVLGRVETKKNVLGSIKAFEKLKKENNCDDINLVLAGSPGYGHKEISRYINNSNFKESIIETGWIDGQDLGILLKQAKITLFPSFYEGFGLPVLESFSCRVPVVVSDNNALNEVAGEAGVYCNPNNIDSIYKSIISLLEDKDLCESKTEKGKQRLDDFSWNKSAKKTAQVLFSS